MAVISVSHFRFGAGAVKSRCNRLGVTGSLCRLSVVHTRTCFWTARKPACRMRRATRCFPQLVPCARNPAWIRGLP
jgi:hypothetical protein